MKITKDMKIYRHCLHAKIETLVFEEEMTDAQKMKKKKEEEKRLIEEADVILTTCASSACDDLKFINRYSAIIIDEACQVLKKKKNNLLNIKKYIFFRQVSLKHSLLSQEAVVKWFWLAILTR